MKTLFRRDSLLWWVSGATYTAGVALLVGAAYFFFTYLGSFEQQLAQYQAGFLGEEAPPSLRIMVIEPYFETIAFLLVLIIPILSLCVFADDRETGFLSFLFSTPMKIYQLVLAKYFAALVNFSCFLLLLALPPAWLLFLSGQSLFPVACGLSSLLLLSSLYISLGMALAQAVKQPFPLTIVHFLCLFVLYFLPAITSEAFGGYGFFLRSLSPVLYSGQLIEGFIATSQFAYFLAATASCLLFAGMKLSLERYSYES